MADVIYSVCVEEVSRLLLSTLVIAASVSKTTRDLASSRILMMELTEWSLLSWGRTGRRRLGGRSREGRRGGRTLLEPKVLSCSMRRSETGALSLEHDLLGMLDHLLSSRVEQLQLLFDGFLENGRQGVLW